MKKVYPVISILVIISISACVNSGKQNREKSQIQIEETANLDRVNKVLADKDKEKIEAFIARNKIKAKFDKSGFWIATTEKGNGEKIGDGNTVAVIGTIQLLDGTMCYRYDENNPMVFIVEKSEELSKPKSQNAITGLHMAVRQMEENERAVIIFPPHLAHGVIGDSDKIPPRAILVYDIKVIKIK